MFTYFGLTESDMEWLARREREYDYWSDGHDEDDEPDTDEEENKDGFTEEEGILLGIYTGGGLF